MFRFKRRQCKDALTRNSQPEALSQRELAHKVTILAAAGEKETQHLPGAAPLDSHVEAQRSPLIQSDERQIALQCLKCCGEQVRIIAAGIDAYSARRHEAIDLLRRIVALFGRVSSLAPRAQQTIEAPGIVMPMPVVIGIPYHRRLHTVEQAAQQAPRRKQRNLPLPFAALIEVAVLCEPVAPVEFVLNDEIAHGSQREIAVAVHASSRNFFAQLLRSRDGLQVVQIVMALIYSYEADIPQPHALETRSKKFQHSSGVRRGNDWTFGRAKIGFIERAK